MDELTGLFNPNDTHEAELGSFAQNALKQGKNQNAVKDRLASLVHAYRASLASQTDAPAPETKGDVAAGMIGSAVQGATLGAGNKVLAGFRTALPEKLGGEKGWDYGQALQDVTQPTQQFSARHPIVAGATEFAASALPIMLTGGGGAVAGDMTKLQKVLALAKTGAKYGGVSGALSANRFQDVLPGAASGAIAGGVMAPVIGLAAPPVIRGAAKMGRKVAGWMGNPQAGEAIARAAGVASDTPQAQAERMLQKSLVAGGANPREMMTSGSETTPMDLSRPTLALARSARNVPTSKAGQTIDTFLEQRSAGTGPRIQGALTAATGQTPEDMALTLEQHAEQMRKTAKPLYDAAMQSPDIPLTAKGEGDVTLGELLQRPSMQKAMRYGEQISAERGTQVAPDAAAKLGISPERLAELKAQGLDKFIPGLASGEEKSMSMQGLHDLKLKLDDMLGYARANGQLPDGTPATKNMLRAVQDTKNQLLSVMDQNNPEYKIARNAWAGDAAIEDAGKLGAEHFTSKMSTPELQRTMESLTPGEQAMYRRAALAEFRDKVANLTANPDLPDAARNVNVVQRLLGTGPQAERARLLFPSEGAYQRFVADMAPETQYPKTDRFLRNQSSTAAQLQEGQMSTPWAMMDVAGAASGKPWYMGKLAIRGYKAITGSHKGMDPAVADALANALTTKGAKMPAMLRRITDDAQQVAARRAMLASLFGAQGGAMAGRP